MLSTDLNTALLYFFPNHVNWSKLVNIEMGPYGICGLVYMSPAIFRKYFKNRVDCHFKFYILSEFKWVA